jgi:hypothetical protein
LLCAWESATRSVCRGHGIYPNGRQIGPSDEDGICQSNYVNADYVCTDGPLLIGTNCRHRVKEKNLRDSEGAFVNILEVILKKLIAGSIQKERSSARKGLEILLKNGENLLHIW